MPDCFEGIYRAVVIGTSTGGVTALKTLLSGLASDFPVPVCIVAHISPDADNGLAILLDSVCGIKVKEADELELAKPGWVYLAPANYHLLMERDGTLSLSTEPLVNFARPAVDVLFESAAKALGPALIGIILTGAGCDGSKGLQKIKKMGGVTIVQSPSDAEMDAMPLSAIQTAKIDHIVTLTELAPLLTSLTMRTRNVCQKL